MVNAKERQREREGWVSRMEEEVEATASKQRRRQCARGRRIGLGVGLYVATRRDATRNVIAAPSVHEECPRVTRRCVSLRVRRRRRRHEGVECEGVRARLGYPRCYIAECACGSATVRYVTG